MDKVETLDKASTLDNKTLLDNKTKNGFDARAYEKELDETSDTVDVVKGITREGPEFAVYNNESATDVYKSMAGGTAQVNAMSDFLQEGEQSMKSNVTVFSGTGFNLGSELPYIELYGPKDTFDYTSNVNADLSTGRMVATEKRLDPYTQACKPEEKTADCLKRVFECDPDRPWRECDDKIQTCKDDPLGQNICKYNQDGTLLKKYEPLKTQIGEPSKFVRIG